MQTGRDCQKIQWLQKKSHRLTAFGQRLRHISQMQTLSCFLYKETFSLHLMFYIQNINLFITIVFFIYNLKKMNVFVFHSFYSIIIWINMKCITNHQCWASETFSYIESESPKMESDFISNNGIGYLLNNAIRASIQRPDWVPFSSWQDEVISQ